MTLPHVKRGTALHVRRSLLRVSAALAGGLFLLLAIPRASTPAASDEPRVWIIDFIPDSDSGIAPQRALVSLQTDGLVRADFASMGASSLEAPRLSGGHGEWRETGGELTLDLIALLVDADQRLLCEVVTQAVGQRTGDGSALTGTWTFVVTEPSGNTVNEGQGIWQGTRALLT